MEKKGMKRGVFIGIWTAVFAVLIALMIVLTVVLNYYDSVVGSYLGYIGGGVTSSGTDDTDTEYFKMDYDSADDLISAEDEANLQMGREAVVMVRNENGALPLSSGAKISLFGMASTGGTTLGTGSGASATSGDTLSSSLTSAGFEVNETLLSYTESNSTSHGTGTSSGPGDEAGDWSLGSEITFPTSGTVADSFSTYSDAAILVLNRNGGEGGDLPRTMEHHGGDAEDNYLTISPSEEQLLSDITSSGIFDKVIVFVNTGNAMELGFLEEYDVDACLWYASLGTTGVNAIGEILAGETSPSGGLVDTYVYDNMSAPAVQNFGDFRFTSGGSLTGYSYVNYAESIYVGYKYYETRYEDAVMGTSGVGSYDYDSTVIYPFGYGLSYSGFEWSDYAVSVDGDDVTVSVKVTNNSSYPGKEVVQIYYQGEYTSFDEANGIEKAAANLVEYAKTGELAKGESETVEVTFSLYDMASYDSAVNGTYILEAGDYYITAASDAHEAVNNILAAKGYTPTSGTGDASLVEKYEQSATATYSEGAAADVTNQFDNASLDGTDRLSRSDWSAMDGGNSTLSSAIGAGALTSATGVMDGESLVTNAAGTVGTIEVSSDIGEALATTGYDASGNPKSTSEYTADRLYSQEGDYELVDMRGLDYDDEAWDTLIKEMKFSQIYELFGHAGYGTIAIDSINKPKTLEYDGPTGINSYVGSATGYGFPHEIAMAATWNKELVRLEGTLIGNDCLNMSSGSSVMSGWYAPAVNIHRTAFSGRNYEYYSEDPVLSGLMVAEVIQGVQSKGVYVYMKHYALNDQETNRAAYEQVCTFSDEQTMREIYLKPFEYGVKDGGAKGIMTSMNRVGYTFAAGNYAMITAVLRNEWGFDGCVITDYTGDATAAYVDQMLAAGGDLLMCSGWSSSTGVLSDYDADWCRVELERAAHNVLYVQANSLVVNGMSHGSTYSSGLAVYKLILIIVWVVVVAGIAVGGFFVYRTLTWSQDQWYARKRISKRTWIIIAAVAVVVVAVAVTLFCTLLLPDLLKAFVL